jgi:hypothetical protein
VMADAASTAAMIEGVGSRTPRWMQTKREDFFLKEGERTGRKCMPKNIVRQNSRFQHVVSSLSSSSKSSNNDGSSGEEVNKKKSVMTRVSQNRSNGAQNVTNSSGGSNDGQPNQNGNNGTQNVRKSSGSSSDGSPNQKTSQAFHDYHAKPLPDPKLPDSGRSSTSTSEDSPEESNTSAEDTKRASSDSSSGEDSAAATNDPRPSKRRKHGTLPAEARSAGAAAAVASTNTYLPQNIAKKGGISHNVRPIATEISVLRNGNARLSLAPAIALPAFSGLGKRSQLPATTITLANATLVPNQPQGIVPDSTQLAEDKIPNQNDTNAALEGPAVIISGDVESASSNSSRGRPQIRAYYHVNEDDMISMEDIIMCPFLFRTQDAVQCGALAECVMTGMLRAKFSPTNKLQSLEMTYDAMGFMQQLERASGSEMTAQIIPGSLEMALSPTTNEARAITLAEPPFQIVNVNEPWTKLTKYTQMEVEGAEIFKLLEGEVSEGNPPPLPYNVEDLIEGRCTCATRIHFDKEGGEFVDYISSYPLTK